VDWAKKSVKGLNIRNSSGFLSPNNASFFAPKPSYSSSSSTVINNNGQKDEKQKTVKTTFSEDVMCWAFNSYLGCPKGKNCNWLHERYDTSKESGFDICWAYNTDEGCRNGKWCEWKHEMHPNRWKILKRK